MRRLIVVGVLVMLLQVSVFAEEKLAAPTQLPHINSSMLSAGFWINQHPSPDRIIMTPEQIDMFNLQVQNDLKLTSNIFATVSEERTQHLLSRLEQIITDYTQQGYYTAQGIKNDSDVVEKNKQNMHLSAVVLGIGPRFGVVVRLTDQRFFPTDEGLYEKLGDFDFDQLQNSALDIGTPVAIVHTSRDKQWVYVYGPNSDGWVKFADIAIGEQDQINRFTQTKNFVVVTNAYADLYADNKMTHLLSTIRMGVKLPLIGINDGVAAVQMPSLNNQGKLIFVNAYVDAAAIHEGYLPMTARTIYTQAFKWLNTPYGWGDFRGFIDCSRLIQSVYATVGLNLPRDSKNQALVGKALASFDETATASQKTPVLADSPAGSLLVLKGHIMLYLGMVDQVPFAIHASSGYRQREGERDSVRSLMRVVVSDLSLGEGSMKGSLLKRLTRIVSIENPDNH